MKNVVRSVAVVVALVLSTLTIAAQQSSPQVFLRAGRVLDVKTGRLLSNQTLVIQNGKIVSTGGTADIKTAADAVVIDLPSATILPGLIDAHTHLTMEPKFGYERLASSIPREALT